MKGPVILKNKAVRYKLLKVKVIITVEVNAISSRRTLLESIMIPYSARAQSIVYKNLHYPFKFHISINAELKTVT